MPRIREYTSQVSQSGPFQVRQASAEDFGAARGRGLQNLGRIMGQVGQIGRQLERRAEQAEVSDLNAKMSKSFADFSTQWQEALRTATPGDPEIVTRFMKDFDDHMGKIQENIGTRAGELYFKKSSASLRSQFLRTTMAGQAELAGAKAKQDYKSSLSNRASGLLNDPSSFGQTLADQSEAIDLLVESHGLSTTQANAFKMESQTELAKSAIRGWIDLDPELAKDQLEKGEWDKYIGGDLKHQLFREAEQTIRAKETELERQRREQERLLDEKQKLTQNELLTKLSKNQLTIQDVLASDLDPFGSGSKEQFIGMLKSANKANERIKTNPDTYMELWDRIHLPDDDPKKLRDENELNQFFGRGLTLENINALRGEIQGKKTIQGDIEGDLKKGLIDIAKGRLTKSNPLTGIRDPIGDEQLQKYMSFFLTEYSEQRKKGKTALELLSPDSPDYLGKHIERFVRSQQQITRDLIRPFLKPSTNSVDPGKARKEGETPEEYLKRVGKGN